MSIVSFRVVPFICVFMYSRVRLIALYLAHQRKKKHRSKSFGNITDSRYPVNVARNILLNLAVIINVVIHTLPSFPIPRTEPQTPHPLPLPATPNPPI